MALISGCLFTKMLQLLGDTSAASRPPAGAKPGPLLATPQFNLLDPPLIIVRGP